MKRAKSSQWRRRIENALLLSLGGAVILLSPAALRAGAGIFGLAILLGRSRRDRNSEIDRFQSILDAIAEPVYIKNRRHEYTLLNRAFCEFLGYPRDSLLGKTASHFAPSAEAKFFWERDEEVFRSSKSIVIEGPVTDAKGAVHTVLNSKARYVDTNGENFVVGVIHDISQRKLIEEALRLNEERYAFVLEGTNDGLLDWDLEDKRVFVSDRWKAMLGFGADEIGDTPQEILSLVHPEDVPNYKALTAAHLRGESPLFEMEIRMRHKDGSYRWMMSRARAVRDACGRPIRMAGSQTDITHLKILEERLRRESSRDELTGIFNRRHFSEQLRSTLAAARRFSEPSSLCLADIDHFKTVNDTNGHAAGDEVLRVFAKLILEEIREEDVASRHGGDEFSILFSHSTARLATIALERIRARLQEHLFVGSGGNTFRATATFGVCDLAAGDDEAKVLARADRALYQAKRLGRDRIAVKESFRELTQPGRLALVG
jgi:diguanylate cyclase (GGDEF)-like protein/PAS domain S-box-containing protein